MNILFLVFGFVSVFLIFSSMLLKQVQAFSSVEKSVVRSVKAQYILHDKWERYKYKNYERKLQPTGSKKSRKSLNKEYLSHRLLYNLPIQAKWNLAPVIFADQTSLSLIEASALFLEQLYGHTLFWKKAKDEHPHLAQEMLVSWQKKKTEKNQIEKLEDLFPEELPLQTVFYKMLKGSGYYNLDSKEGYPPLGDFFRLSKEEMTVLCLPYASTQALEVLLGLKMARAIVEIERDKWISKGGYYSITKAELLALTATHASNLSIQEIDYFLVEGHKKGKLEKLTHKEGKTLLSFPLP
jgi:hypothetical protein